MIKMKDEVGRNMTDRQFYLGAAYYPEMWDKKTIDTDIQKMQQIGINTVRIAEFAWSTMEPREGEFDFSLFGYVIDKMAAAGIGVILCTPTCTPPKWLTDKYGETLRTLDDGKKVQFGAREHACKSSHVFREKTRIIVEQMCKALAHKEGIIGWQIDNEIYPYDNGCFCPQCRQKFHACLRKKYSNIENLNTKWGTNRWSLSYRDFDDVIPPRKDTWNHPSLEADWHSFQCEKIIDFVHFQKQIIARYTNAPVGTDMMTCADLDYDKMNEELDVVQFNHYEKESDLWFAAFWFDYMRTIKDRPFWCMETQPNWNGAFCAQNGKRAVENCYANTLMPYLKGGEMNMTWLWRTHPCGQEMWHGALLDCAGREYLTTPQFRRVNRDLHSAYEALSQNKIYSRIAIHISSTADIQLRYAEAAEGFKYIPELRKVYRGFLHHNVDMIGLDHDLTGYKVLLSPFVCCIDQQQKEQILSWVEKGGRWIVGPMADIYDDALRRYTDSPFGFLEKVTSTYCKYNVPIDHDDYRATWADHKPISCRNYYDGYETQNGDVLASYTQGDLEGLAMIVEEKYGKGSLVLVGSVLESTDWEKLAGQEPILQADDNVMLNQRENGIITCLEVFNKAGKVELDGDYRDLLTGQVQCGTWELRPYQAAVLEKLK